MACEGALLTLAVEWQSADKPQRLEGFDIMEQREKAVLTEINKSLKMTVYRFLNKRVQIRVLTRKFKQIGEELCLCKGYIPLSKFLESSVVSSGASALARDGVGACPALKL